MTPLAALALAALITFHHAAAIPAVLGAVVALPVGRRIGHRDAGRGLLGLYVRRRWMGRAS